ncbi:MAG: DnaJ domain-containing protein [Crocinitomix sp.]|nr:DnaJ domain-containing protein [Crocinitomix sp.]
MATKPKFNQPKLRPLEWIPMVIFGSLFLLILGAIVAFIIPWMLFVIAAIVLFYGINRMRILKSTNRDYGFLGNEEDLIKFILALTAYIAKSDNRIRPIEQKYVEDLIRHDFKEAYSEHYIEMYNNYLKIDINLNKVCFALRTRYNLTSKIHLLHFLVGLVAADGVLSRDEEHKLFAIARYLRIPYSSLRSIIALFNLKREEEQAKKQSNNSYKRSNSSSRTIANAYAILDISVAVSNEKLKKAYRKLAKRHHPDKVAHLGKIHQEKAKIKFQKILTAYELIKKSRNLA